MRLAMSILVRDEADIIEANIRHHAKLGVSRFIVTDNGSIDGTRHILAQLQYEFDLTIIDEPEHTIDQDIWVTRMARMLAENDAADWVINNDADEFWMPVHGSLIDAINSALNSTPRPADEIGLLYCARHNLIPSLEATELQDYSFRDNRYRVVNTWYDSGSRAEEQPESSVANSETAAASINHPAWHKNGSHIMIRTLPGKVITRLNGLQTIDMGNHGASHALDQIQIDTIDIAHYPVRDFSQFEKKVVNYGTSLENNQRFNADTSRHLRHWYQCYLAGQLPTEYKHIVLPKNALEKLVDQDFLMIEAADQQQLIRAAA